MNPILTERILAIAQAAEKAGHGGKDAVYQTGCQALGISRATLLRRIKQVSYKPPRKQRVDYGTSALTRDEALLISGVIMESERKNGKRLYSLEKAVNDLRANNLINAGYIDNILITRPASGSPCRSMPSVGRCTNIACTPTSYGHQPRAFN